MQPGRSDLVINEGEDFAKAYAFYERGGRVIEDLVTTNASTTATSATAAFTSADTGKKIATADGTGIADGTTMTYVNSTTVTLSAAATATLTEGVAVVRALNCSAYTAHAAEIRKTEDAATTLATLPVDTSREAVGFYTIELAAADTATLGQSGVWDWQVTGPNGISYWYAGKARFLKRVTT